MDEVDDVQRLTREELLAMAGLLRLLIRLDGRFTDGEREALSRVATMVSEPVPLEDVGSPYRTSSGERIQPIGEERLFELLELAGEQLSDGPAVREAALAITRQEAREAIYGVVFEVAASDMASQREPELLDWLAKHWELPVEAVE